MPFNLPEPGVTWENSCYSLYHVPASMPRDVDIAEPFSKFLSAFTFSDEEICYPCARVWVPGIILIQLLAVAACMCGAEMYTGDWASPFPKFCLL